MKGTRFGDLIPYFADDVDTDALVIIGKIGGDEEEELTRKISEHGFNKPVYALISGQAAREGVTTGHAGALIHGDVGTVESKTRHSPECARLFSLVFKISSTPFPHAEDAPSAQKGE